MLDALSRIEAFQSIDLNYNIPLMLPAAWEEKWTVFMQTQFVAFCK